MKSLTTLVFVCFLTSPLFSQSVLTLAECYERAAENYPLTRQRALIEKTRNLSVENALKGNLPAVHVGGQATYQSEVTQIPVEMPGVEPLSKDQYRIFGEISQTLYHGGLVSAQRKQAERNALVEEKELDVELYKLNDRINELFFGILLLQEQVIQRELVRKDLNAALQKTEASVVSGTAIPSAADVLKAELLTVDQRMIEMESAAAMYRETLGHFIGVPVTAETVLRKPEFSDPPKHVNRPELDLFDLRARSLESNLAMLSAGKKPRVELFVQGGYGRPGLNMLEDAFEVYYVGGIRFSWRISGYYTFTREKEILNLRRQSLGLQEEAFRFNTDLELNQYEAEISKLRQLMEVDNEIIGLRTRVRQIAGVQLGQGVITPADFIREVNAEDQAKQNRALHETQLLMAQAKYHFTSGQ